MNTKTLLEQVEEEIRGRVFSHNKAISKNQSEPIYADADHVVEAAMHHLIEALADLALEKTDL